MAAHAAFQSPSLRGSGRFTGARRREARRAPVSIPFIAGQWSLPSFTLSVVERGSSVSIPFIAGQWSLRGANVTWRYMASLVSIPFIAGQWSLLIAATAATSAAAAFQSPSLRGSGRFDNSERSCKNAGSSFNPLHCGAVVASHCRIHSSWMSSTRFNPLHCGAVVASGSAPHRDEALPGVSIPFIAGQWSLHCEE